MNRHLLFAVILQALGSSADWENKNHPGQEPVPDEYKDFKFLIFESLQTGERFWSTNSGIYEKGWYKILAGYNTTEECLKFLGYS